MTIWASEQILTHSSGSVRSARTTSTRSESFRKLSLEPLTKESTTFVLATTRTSSSVKCEHMNPAPPVTTTLLPAHSTSKYLSTISQVTSNHLSLILFDVFLPTSVGRTKS